MLTQHVTQNSMLASRGLPCRTYKNITLQEKKEAPAWPNIRTHLIRCRPLAMCGTLPSPLSGSALDTPLLEWCKLSPPELCTPPLLWLKLPDRRCVWMTLLPLNQPGHQLLLLRAKGPSASGKPEEASAAPRLPETELLWCSCCLLLPAGRSLLMLKACCCVKGVLMESLLLRSLRMACWNGVLLACCCCCCCLC